MSGHWEKGMIGKDRQDVGRIGTVLQRIGKDWEAWIRVRKDWDYDRQKSGRIEKS